MKHVKIIFFLAVLTFVFSSFSLKAEATSYGDLTNNEGPVLYFDSEDFDNPEIQAQINKAINDPNVESFTIIFTDEESLQNDEGDISPFAPHPLGFYLKNRKTLSTVIDYGHIANVVSGESGITLNLDYDSSYSVKISRTFGATNGALSAGLGFDVTKSYGVRIGGKYTVPSHVKSAMLMAHPVYERFSYDVWYKDPSFWIADKYQGTGIAQKPLGFHYAKRLTY